ncbi:MAG: hypothetical protein HC848_10660, partial [Limnobacter sp.]|nr:hypothetical protein [Limnobacter sp.]
MSVLQIQEIARANPGLRSLDLSKATGVTDAHIAALAGFSSLQALTLPRAPDLTDKSLEVLGKLGSLENLCIHRLDKNCTYTGLAAMLKGMQSLRALELPTCYVLSSSEAIDAVASVLKNLPMLRRLSLSDLPNSFRNPFRATALGELRQLTHLNLHGRSAMQAEEVRALAKLTNLQEAKLAREAELCFATLALATDYDCWNTEHGDVVIEDVLTILKNNVT